MSDLPSSSGVSVEVSHCRISQTKRNMQASFFFDDDGDLCFVHLVLQELLLTITFVTSEEMCNLYLYSISSSFEYRLLFGNFVVYLQLLY